MQPTLIRRFATPVSTTIGNNIAKGAISKPATSSQTHSRKSAQKPNRPSRIASRADSKSPPLSLEHFLLRSRVLNLYRTIVRAIYTIPDKQARKEPMAYASAEFRRHSQVRDTEKIRYLASVGKTEWDGMRRYIEELGARSEQLKGK